MIIKLIGIATASALVVGCAAGSGSTGSNGIKSGPGYPTSASGSVISSASGLCIHSASYNKNNTILDCDPDAKAAKMAADDMAAAEKKAAEMAAAEKKAAEMAAAEKKAAEMAAAEKAAMAAAAANKKIAMSLSGKALFASNSSTLSPKGYTALDKLIANLANFSKIDSLTVIGHTDSQGGAAFNKELSRDRAASVRDQIAASGVASLSQITVIGKGEEEPLANNETAEGRSQNRRVEIEVHGIQ